MSFLKYSYGDCQSLVHVELNVLDYRLTRSLSRGQSSRSVSSQPMAPMPASSHLMLTKNLLLVTGEVNGFDASLLHKGRSSLLGRLEGRSAGRVDSRNEGPLLNRGSLDLLQGAAESSACTARRHCVLCREWRYV